MAKHHVSIAVMEVSAAQAGGSDLQQDLIAGQLRLLCLRLLDGTILEAFEDCEGRHDVVAIVRSRDRQREAEEGTAWTKCKIIAADGWLYIENRY